jgi:hypothetical protein
MGFFSSLDFEFRSAIVRSCFIMYGFCFLDLGVTEGQRELEDWRIPPFELSISAITA